MRTSVFLRATCLIILSAVSIVTCGLADPLPSSGNVARTANTLLWRIGLNDGTNQEFTKTADDLMPQEYAVAPNWAQQTQWPEWPAVPKKHTTWTTSISYKLPAVPANGVLFTFKAVTATIEVPELAVYSNFNPCGIIQIGGAKSPGWGPKQDHDRTFTRPYQLYIPATMLQAGTNLLHLSALGNPYKRETNIYLDFTIDYLQLESLAAPIAEPIHGKESYLGISDGNFDMTPAHTAIQQAESEWMGVAYCGNPARVCFWNDITARQPDRMAFIQKQRDLNMTVILNGWNCGHSHDADIVYGQLPDKARAYLDGIFKDYGALAQFYEICNEPTQNITQASQQVCLAVARYVNSIKPATVTLAAPGYTFGGGFGDPVNWDTSDANRQELDALCGAYNGHSFSSSFGYDKGSLTENVDAHGVMVNGNPVVANGWDKPFIVTECGSNTNNADYPQGCTNPDTQRYSSTLDRNLRAHVAWADYSCAADMWNNGPDYNYITGKPTDPGTWGAAVANEKAGDNDSRPKALRRIALAYCTHGAPLPYVWQNTTHELRLVYFRAVDTSRLAPLPGSDAHSDKVLLSFVNFDLENSNTLSVKVQMPVAGKYTGVYYDGSNTYTAARHVVTGLTASPVLPLTVKLGPGESVEYILDRPGAASR